MLLLAFGHKCPQNGNGYVPIIDLVIKEETNSLRLKSTINHKAIHTTKSLKRKICLTVINKSSLRAITNSMIARYKKGTPVFNENYENYC